MRYIITHGHIFKNAGTTFDFALKNAFGNDFLDHRDDQAMRKGGADYLRQLILDAPNLKAISSHHLCAPLPISEDFRCIPVYFLRNPIERALSVYNFERKQKNGTKGAEMASSLSLIDYIGWRLSPNAPKVICDYQTGYLGRDNNLKPRDPITHSIFESACRKIADESALVGTVEEFDKSFIYITRELKRYFPDVDLTYENRNVSNSASYEDKFQSALNATQPILSKLITANCYDIALHKIASEALQKRYDDIFRQDAFDDKYEH